MSPNRLYWEVKRTLWRNWVRQQAQRPVRTGMTLVVLAAIWLMLFAIFRAGFAYAEIVPYLDVYLISGMFGVFFLLVFFLLILTNIVLTNTGLYYAAEAELLMVLPIAPERAAMYRSAELSLLNSLGALYVITPLVGAYALTLDVAAARIAQDALLLLPFLVIPNVLGIALTLALRRISGSLRTRVVVAGGIVVFLAAVYALFTTFQFDAFREDDHPVRILNQAADMLSGTRKWFLPSFWYVEAVFSPARGYPKMTYWYGGVLLAVAAAGLLLWAALVRRWYYASWLAGSGAVAPEAARARRPVNWLAQWAGLLRPLPGQVRTLAAKDLLMFVREPVVRTQGVVMIGLLLVYFAMLPSIYTGLVEHPYHKLFIAGANLIAIGIVLAAFGCRFYLPLLSLEGRKFWLLRTAPPSTGTILLEKWAFASLIFLLIGQPLLAYSNYLTTMDRVFVGASHGALLALSPTLAAICIGVGAIFPDFSGERGGRNAQGPAATLAFVCCIACIGGVAALIASPYYAYVVLQRLSYDAFQARLLYNLAGAALIGCGVGLLFLLAGHDRLERWEIP